MVLFRWVNRNQWRFNLGQSVQGPPAREGPRAGKKENYEWGQEGSKAELCEKSIRHVEDGHPGKVEWKTNVRGE